MAPSFLTRLIESQASPFDNYSTWHVTASTLRARAYAGVAGALGLEAARRAGASQSTDARKPECILEMANTILVEASKAFHVEHLKDEVAIKLLSSAYGNCSRALMGQ